MRYSLLPQQLSEKPYPMPHLQEDNLRKMPAQIIKPEFTKYSFRNFAIFDRNFFRNSRISQLKFRTNLIFIFKMKLKHTSADSHNKSRKKHPPFGRYKIKYMH